MSKPKTWAEVYRNDDDRNVFVGKDGVSGLTRSKFDWRTVDALSKESGLTKEKVEKILDYYNKKGICIQHANGEKWGYWENVGANKEPVDVVKVDQDERASKNEGKIKSIVNGFLNTKPAKTVSTPINDVKGVKNKIKNISPTFIQFEDSKDITITCGYGIV